MFWQDELKNAGINIHVIATGGGAGLQEALWHVPGSSTYLSGASFPYAQDEQIELLGFTPEHFCSEEAAIDLASAAYMKAFKFGGKKPVGLGITASVASEKAHRGDHRVFVCIMTDDRVRLSSIILEKGVGATARHRDGMTCDEMGLSLLLETVCPNAEGGPSYPYQIHDVTAKASIQFFKHPFFTANGKRVAQVPQGAERSYAMMPGSFNPPHT